LFLFPTLAATSVTWAYVPAIQKLALALALGLFVGMERERRGKQAGLRTFALVCLLGAMGGILGTAYALAALGLLGIIVLLITMVAFREDRDIEVTTSVTICVVGFIGVLCGLGHTLTPLAVGIVVAALLSWKEHMVPFFTGLTEEEVRSAILLGIIAFVIYPGLPEGTIDPWGLVNIRTAWVTVIMIAALGFVNYILLKQYGSKGIELTGFLGGLINTKVTTVELSRRAKENVALADAAFGGVLLSRASMVLRNGFIMMVLSTQAFLIAVPAFALMLVGSVSFLVRRFIRKDDQTQENEGESLNLRIEAPFSLQSVLKFGVIFLVLQITGILAERAFGSFGFYIVTAIGGMFSSASAVSSAAALAANGSITPFAAGIGAIIASIISSAVDVMLVSRLTENPALSRRLTVGIAWICGLGLLGAGIAVFLHPPGL